VRYRDACHDATTEITATFGHGLKAAETPALLRRFRGDPTARTEVDGATDRKPTARKDP
jgi:hypothetical protein